MYRLIGILSFFLMEAALAQRPVTVGVVFDGEQYQFVHVAEIFKRELLALTEGEFDVDFIDYRGNWTRDSIVAAFDQAYANPDVDLVLAMGFAANQIMVSREQFPKPTFLPLVFDAELTGAPTEANGNGSGKRNLNYLTGRVPLEQELKAYQRIVNFDKAVVFVDALIAESIPNLGLAMGKVGEIVGVSFSYVEHDGQDHDLATRVPPDAQAVLYTGLPRMPDPALDKLIADLNRAGIPSFSISERVMVDRGMLAADTVDTDWQRLGRRNALGMQSVLLGESTSKQSIFFTGKQELTINMNTARLLNLSPRFDVLSEATLLFSEPPPSGPILSLKSVAEMALQANLDLQSQAINIATAEQDVRLADSGLLPQLSLGASRLQRKTGPNVNAGLFPETSVDGNLSLSQVVYSDDVFADKAIARFNKDAVTEGYQSQALDILNEATQAYIDVLRAQNQLNIQQQNLELTKSNLDLARDRVRLGASSNADVFRWESNLAISRSQVLQADASLRQAREVLNRVLNRPVTDPFTAQPASVNDPFVMSMTEFDRLVNSPRTFGWLADFAVEFGLANAPELKQIDAQIALSDRDILNRKRDFWLPDLSVAGQLTDNLDQSGVGAGGLTDGQSDWTVSLNASLPVFTGGARRAALSRSELQLRQLKIQREALAQRIEQQIRSTMHIISANYANIELSKAAADAADRNLELVTDSYARGTMSILELLDAQSQSLNARLSADNAVYDFLSSAITMQRAASRFDFLLSQEEQAIVLNEFEQYFLQKEAELSGSQ